ncbi:Esterase E4 [Cryptotermes secundus]|uniref:Carboxylic ester hydrolase n=1 Tax=Cryptotermes secundus TaxID=105785 RepID=A0A2J7PWN0_9NEOP|nr:esterase E4 isoform X2 [Cryptotermes secundus]PNF20732.1 Esterase E4 [Cryptotermes secundus]
MQTKWRRHMAALIVSCALQMATHGSQAVDSGAIRVTVRQGVMRGKTMTSAKGRTFYSFQGIPYAKPPTGLLRFRETQTPTSWEGELDATKPGPKCIQLSIFVTGSEDCLYLNVFTPQLPQQNGSHSKQNGDLLDVMCWIHGGLFYSGSAQNYPPDFLMDKNVVLVTFNYRLGVYGFLSTGDDESPGNYGLKDQRAALMWVQENIAVFGGNPKSVTLFGESSGATCVHCHMLSPFTEGLFHRAISMAGTAISPWASCPDPLSMAQEQAKLVNCSTANTSTIVACLKDTDPVLLVKTYPSEPLFARNRVFTPCPEQQSFRNPEPFLPGDPLDLIRAGKFKKIPWIVGANSQDASTFIVPILNLNRLRARWNKNFEQFTKSFLFLPKKLTKVQADGVYEKFIDFYLNGTRNLSQQDAYQIIEGFSDRHFIHPVKKSVDLHLSVGHEKIFWYNLAYRGFYSTTYLTSLRNYGVGHVDERRYIFPMSFFWPYSENDKEVSELILNLWTNFAKFENPTPANKPPDSSRLLDKITWFTARDVGPENMHTRYFNIGQVILGSPTEFLNENLGPVKINMAEDLDKERMDFWDSLPLNEN